MHNITKSPRNVRAAVDTARALRTLNAYGIPARLDGVDAETFDNTITVEGTDALARAELAMSTLGHDVRWTDGTHTEITNVTGTMRIVAHTAP